MELTNDNYYSMESNMYYCSVSQYKSFIGTPSNPACEAAAMADLRGEIEHKAVSTALLVGSYVDAYYSGEFDQFIDEHPEIFRMNGTLKSAFKQANTMIARSKKDALFQRYMEGDKQLILTGDIEGVPFKVKIDSTDHKRITDLKTVRKISETFFVKDSGERITFIEKWNYDLQAAIYQEIYFQNYGKRLPFYICAVDKSRSSIDGSFHPRIAVIQIPQSAMDDRLAEVRHNVRRIEMLKTGEIEPIACGVCDYCADTLPLTRPISIDELLTEVQ